MATAPISLYFGVQKGKHADLETVARASLEWAALIRDVAAVVAPDLEFEIEFVESEEGSLWLSNLLRAVKDGDRKALLAIVGAVLAYFAMGPAEHLRADFSDWVLEKLGHKHSDEDKEDARATLIEKVRQAVKETQIEARRRNLIAIVERDREVDSVGVDFSPNASGPATRISREQFASYDALPPTPELREVREDNVIYERNIDVYIEKASLKKGDKKPRWRFRQGDETWSATIVDEDFVWALNSEKTGLPLAVGQLMRVDVAIQLKEVDGVWEERDRKVIRVRIPQVPRAQGALALGSE